MARTSSSRFTDSSCWKVLWVQMARLVSWSSRMASSSFWRYAGFCARNYIIIRIASAETIERLPLASSSVPFLV
jgi:hypothetical protein